MNVLQETFTGIPACFSSVEKVNDETPLTRSGQSVIISIYRTKIADQCRLITVTWCKTLLLHGLSISVEGPEGESQYTCKIDMKPWYLRKKHGSKRFLVDSKPVYVFWDLRVARFAGDAEPVSEYYVAIVSDEQVVLHLGNMRKEAYRKTGCRPSLIDPILVSRKEHIFGRRKFVTRVQFQEKGNFSEISIECKDRIRGQPEMEIRINGISVIQVKQLQWKFRGNQCVNLNKMRIEVYWDVHDWIFSPGLHHGSFVFKPCLDSVTGEESGSSEFADADFSLFLYAWKVE